MLRRLLIVLLYCAFTGAASAQGDTTHIRISLITCGTGDEEVYEVFGHTAIRIVDSADHTDLVYNYGEFSYGPNFEIQFLRGKLLYCLGVYPFVDFMQEYVEAHRSVQEQQLLLTPQQKEQVYSFLELNAQPQNKYYKYDFFFDNCATRIRDIFSAMPANNFQFANVLPPGKNLSFRDIINQYFYRDHWTRLGINLLLGSRIDRVMTNKDIMFLPDYLRDGVGGATADGHPIAAPPATLLSGQQSGPAGINWAFITTILLCLLTILGYSVASLRWLARVMGGLLMLITGLLGLIIMFMWFGTDHQGCSNNLNLLWCLPTNIILAFAHPRGRSRYALIAIFLLFVSLICYAARIQGLTPEMLPLMLGLLFVYGAMYRHRTHVSPAAAPQPAAPLYYYTKVGSGSALVLIHGFPESGALWQNIRDTLAAHYTLIIPDLPGAGHTPIMPVTIHDMAHGIHHILDKEGIDKAVIAGHSMGGYIAFAFASLFPARVAGLAAIHSTPAADDEEKKQTRKKVIALLQKGGKEAFIKSMVPNLFSAHFKQNHPGVVEQQVQSSLQMSAESMVNFYTAMMERHDRTAALEAAHFPVLWIAGADDTTLPNKKILEKSYTSPINFVTFYQNCGHMSMLENPDQLTADLQSFAAYCYSRHSNS